MRGELRDIANLSAPAVATQMLLPLTAALVTYLAARSGAEVVAAFAVAQRVETLGFVGISATTVAIVPFVAQNLGAGRIDRVGQSVAFARKIALYWGGGLFVVLLMSAEPTARVFADDAVVVDMTELYFRVVGLSFAPYGMVMMTAACLNGMQRPRHALLVLLTKSILFTAPLVVAGSFFGASGIFVGIALSHALGAVVAALVMRHALRGQASVFAEGRAIDDQVPHWRALTLAGAGTDDER